MKSKLLAALAFIPSVSLAQSVYDPTPEQDRESNVGCMSSNCISNMELDNRNLPMIRVAPSFTTRLKFPREIVKCEDDTDTLKICDADRPKDCDEGGTQKDAPGRAKPFWQARVKVVVSPDKIVGSIFSLPPVNVLCDFANGDTITFYAKVSPNPHHIVRFVDKQAELSGLAWLFSQDQKGHVVPIDLSPRQAPPPSTVVRFDDGSGRGSSTSEAEVLEKLFAERERRK